jgi:hypothetical protein
MGKRIIPLPWSLPSFSADGSKAILYDLRCFRETLDGYSQDGKGQLFEILDKVPAKF